MSLPAFTDGKVVKGSKVARAYSWKGIATLLDRQKSVINIAQKASPTVSNSGPDSAVPLPIQADSVVEIPPAFILDPEPIFDFAEEISPVSLPPPSKATSKPVAIDSSKDQPAIPRAGLEVVSEKIYEQSRVLIPKQEPQRVKTLDEIRPDINWKSNDNAWRELMDYLIRKYRIDRRLLEELKLRKALWAADARTLATASRAVGSDEIVGVSLLRLDSRTLAPQILLPDQRGLFSIGAPFAEAKKFVVAANPIEALSYLQYKQLTWGDDAKGIHVVSTDGLLPPEWWIEQVYDAVKDQIEARPDDSLGPVIATHESLDDIRTPPALRSFFPEADNFRQFLSLAVVDVAMIHSASVAEKSTAWNAELQRYLAEVQARARDQAEEK